MFDTTKRCWSQNNFIDINVKTNLYCNKYLKFTNNTNIKIKPEIAECGFKSLKLLIKKN